MVPDLLDYIGQTPLVELTALQVKPGVRIFAKIEGQNPSGSVKDRIALGLVLAAERDGRLKPGGTIVEASSGNTGIALAMVGKRRGYDVKVVLPKATVPAIVEVLALYGVDGIFCEQCQDMRQAVGLAKSMAERHGWHMLGQFDDPTNVRVHYEHTGGEILAQLPQVDVFVAGIGTGGTIMGVGQRLREANPAVRIVGIEPKMGDRLQGLCSMSDGFRPPLLKMDQLDGRWLVDHASAILAAERVIKSEAINAGISAGAALHVALREAERLEQGNIVVMFSDGGWKYLPAKPWEAARAGDPTLDDVHWW